MAFGRTAEGVRVVSDSECWLCLLQQTLKFLQGKFSEGYKIVQSVRVEKRKQRKA